MKPTSPLSLLLFLRLASSAPILDTECHSRTCIISLLTSPHHTHNPPPTHFTEPHFPNHQLADDLSHESPSQAPVTTTSSLPSTTESLSSNEPVSSSFMLSLTNPASHPSIQHPPNNPDGTTSNGNLPSKPSSALPDLRAADLRIYWETLRPSPKPHYGHSCTGDRMSEGDRYYHQRIGSRRDFADLMVVGIVVLFLAVVVALEAIERCGSLSGVFGNKELRRGENFLEDDDNLFIVKRPFELSPAPAARNEPSSRSQSVDSYMDEKRYDSDANERA